MGYISIKPLNIRVPVYASVLTLIGISILLSLGLWQLKRLEWKTALIASIQEGSAQDLREFIPSDLSPDLRYHGGYITGKFDFSNEIAVLSKVYKGEPGYHIITPLIISGDHVVLINRGWAPLGYQTRQNISSADDIDGEMENGVRIFGMIDLPPRINAFTPENVPDKEQWYYLDISEFSDISGYKNIAPIMFVRRQNPDDLQCDDKARIVNYPDPCGVNFDMRNNHMQYAVFWFAMACALAAVYALRFIRKA